MTLFRDTFCLLRHRIHLYYHGKNLYRECWPNDSIGYTVQLFISTSFHLYVDPMILKSIRVRNLRSIKDETLICDNLTALVGANGSGKSSFLHAIELFQDKSLQVDEEDYYGKNTSQDIVIAVTFKDLSQSAKNLFAKYIQNEELMVEMVIAWNDGKIVPKFHGLTLRNPDFVAITSADNATVAKKAYNMLKARDDYDYLPTWSNFQTIKERLEKWEAVNPTKCKRIQDDGQFFGFREVAGGYLGRFVRFLYIPAVRDATDDAQEGRNSVLTQLMNLVIRNRLAEREDVKKFQEDSKKAYSEIMDISNLKELKELEEKMTKDLQNFVPDAKINLTWKHQDLEIKLPDAIVNMVEDGYQTSVAKTGHGLQRAFIMTMLQQLSIAQASKITDETASYAESATLVLVMEEPELYQHPSRQRHLAEMLLALTEGTIPGVSEKMQIVYSTHSPHFVGIDRINQIRLLRKINIPDEKPKITKISSTNLDEITNELSKLWQHPEFTVDTLTPRLQRIMTPWMNEGFFSDVVVLVEGKDDRAAIIGTAKSLDYKLDSMGISVIPCFGKGNLIKPAIIFKKFNIPVYVIWDGDKGNSDASAEENQRLLSLMGHDNEDWPSTITDTFTCFETNMQDFMKNEIGKTNFERYMNDCENDFCMKRKESIKNPTVISTIIKRAKEDGQACKKLEMIVKSIVKMKQK